MNAKKQGFLGKRFWQPNYYEHVIRNEAALQKIQEYIENPLAEKMLHDEIMAGDTVSISYRQRHITFTKLKSKSN
jgi:ATP-dependent Clp protease ATP-binding subunit ClpA